MIEPQRVEVGDFEVRLVSGSRVLWKLQIKDIVAVGEYTNQSGPVADDWFVVLVLRGGRTMRTFPVTESWSGSVLEKLGNLLGEELAVGLANSVDFESRVIWPLNLKGKALFDFWRVPGSGVIGKVVAKVFPRVEAVLTDEIYAFASRADS